MTEQSSKITITWQANTRKAGEVIAFHKTESGTIPIFPSAVNFIPAWTPGAKPRFRQPQVDETEECIIQLNPQGNAYHAYPVGGLALNTLNGVFILPSQEEQDQPDVVVTPMYGANACAWQEGDVVYIALVPKKSR